MDVIDYLASSNYVIVNRSLMMTIGINEALLLGELASECKYWRDAGKLKDGEWFFSTDENLGERLPMSDRTIRRTIDRLKELGVVETKLMGVPAKRYFSLAKVANQGYENLANQGYENLAELYKNKEEEQEKKENTISDLAPQDSRSGNTVRMKPSALRQELARIFKASDPSKKQSTQSIIRIQERIDDDSLIIKAARKMQAQEPIEIKGNMWKPDYFWFVNPEKTDIVVKRIIEAVKDDLIEEEIPEGLKEQYDVAIRLGEAKNYAECKENWGMILPKIFTTDEYKELTNGR